MICPKCEKLMDAMGYDDWMCPNSDCKYVHYSGDEDEECTHPAEKVTMTTMGDYCECGETLNDFTGSNEMGG